MFGFNMPGMCAHPASGRPHHSTGLTKGDGMHDGAPISHFKQHIQG